MTQDEYLAAVRAVHGDRYDYSRLVYKNKRTKVEVICREHGPFWQIAYAHKRGDNCPKCARRDSASNTTEFIDRARKVHGDRYDYSKAVYKTATFDKVIVICQIHGEWECSPCNHLRGTGCSACALLGKIITCRKRKKTTEEFIERANKIHDGRYGYESAVYVGALSQITVTCWEHGDFSQLAS